MGCVECRICHQNEEKNQFDFPFETPNKNKLTYENTDLNDIGLTTNTNFNSNQAQNPNFLQEFEEKLNSIGKYIPEEEFKNLLSEIEPNLYIPNEPFPFEIRNNSHKMKPIEFNFSSNSCKKLGFWAWFELKLVFVVNPISFKSVFS